VALIGAFSALVAQAIPGASSAPAARAPAPAVPTTTPSTITGDAGVPNRPATIDPTLQPAPPPVLTPHRAVTHSGGS